MKKVIPVTDFIVLEKSLKQEVKILMPDSVGDKSGMHKFTVVDLGPDVKNVKIGDSVVTNSGLFRTEVDGKEVYFTKEELVCLIIREE